MLRNIIFHYLPPWAQGNVIYKDFVQQLSGKVFISLGRIVIHDSFYAKPTPWSSWSNDPGGGHCQDEERRGRATYYLIMVCNIVRSSEGNNMEHSMAEYRAAYRTLHGGQTYLKMITRTLLYRVSPKKRPPKSKTRNVFYSELTLGNERICLW